MSLPIPPMSGTVTAALAAARLATTVAQQVASVVAEQASGSMAFGEIFQGETPAGEPKASLDDLKQQFAESARKTLASLGIGPSEAVSLSIDQTGRIEIAGDNPQSVQNRAAQIEAALTVDPGLSRLAQQMLSISGKPQAIIELPSSDNLTIPLPQANMGRRFGG